MQSAQKKARKLEQLLVDMGYPAVLIAQPIPAEDEADTQPTPENIFYLWLTAKPKYLYGQYWWVKTHLLPLFGFAMLETTHEPEGAYLAAD